MYGRIHDATPTHQPGSAYTAVVARWPDTGLYTGYVPGLSGAHSQAETLEELNANLRDVVSLIVEDGPPPLAGEFVGAQVVVVAKKPCGIDSRTEAAFG